MREVWAQRGFSPVDLLNLWEPTGAWEEYPGLIYGEGPRQKLDVYKPRHAAKAPVVVFFYGGSWQGGSRDLYPFVGASLAAQGIRHGRARLFDLSARALSDVCRGRSASGALCS